MKVLHISTTDFGGAAKGMLSIHYALIHSGVESKILVAQKHLCDSHIVEVQPNHNLYSWSKFNFIRIIQIVLRKFNIGLTKMEKIQRAICKIPQHSRSSCFTFPITYYDVSEHPLVKDADVIHLHWIANFIDFQTFFLKVKKPIVWTLRDENPGLGGFHYITEKEKFLPYYEELETEFLSVKRHAIESCPNISIIALSDVMISFAKSVDYLSKCPITKIYNLVNSDSFCLIDKKQAKYALGIGDDAFVVSFVSVTLRDRRKCLKEVLSAISKCHINILLLAVGINDYFDEIPKNVMCLGSISNDRMMSLIYSASDVFLTPSLQESFGKTTIEALLCGTPVISYRTGVANEVINASNGVLIDEVTSDAISEALIKVRTSSYNNGDIRKAIMKVIYPTLIVNQHIECYQTALARNGLN